MNKLFDIFRMVFFSFELASILIVIVIFNIFPDLLLPISELLYDYVFENVLYIFTIYISFILVSNYLLKEILFANKYERLLINWGQYWQLKYRSYMIITVNVLALIFSLILYSYKNTLTYITLAMYFFMFFMPSVIGIISGYIAHITLRIILVEHDENSD